MCENKEILTPELIEKAIRVARRFTVEDVERFKKSFILSDKDEYILIEHIIKARPYLEILDDLNMGKPIFYERKYRILRFIIQHEYFLAPPVLFLCNNATEEQMRYRCKLLNKTENTTNFCIDAFVYKFKTKNLAFKYNKVDEFGYLKEDDVRALKSKLKKQLETYINPKL